MRKIEENKVMMAKISKRLSCHLVRKCVGAMAVLHKGLQAKEFDFAKLSCLELEVDRALSASLKHSILFL